MRASAVMLSHSPAFAAPQGQTQVRYRSRFLLTWLLLRLRSESINYCGNDYFSALC